MTRSSTASPEESFILADEADRYFCPVCGIGLAKSDFDTPLKHYYCPYCSTRQTPLSEGVRRDRPDGDQRDGQQPATVHGALVAQVASRWWRDQIRVR